MFGKLQAVVAAAAMLVLSAACGAHASSITALWTFCPGGDCSQGGEPSSPVLVDKYGNLYGSTADGGANNAGAIYEYTTAGKFVDLMSFCSTCAAGSRPYGPLIIDKKGNIYGTASLTPANINSGAGVVYELVKSEGFAEHVLYAFCPQAPCTDGFGPSFGLTYAGQQSGLAYDGTSPLYGVTTGGGALNDGVAFELTFKRKVWTFKMLHSFCSAQACADGKNPNTLIVDASGNLYGSTSAPALSDIFKMAPDGTETVLYHFCAKKSCADGDAVAGIFMDAAGNFFGANTARGKTKNGVLFELDAKGGFHDLYNFCQQKGCPDGYGDGVPVMDTSGALYGLLTNGGQLAAGSAYKFPASGSFTKLFDFCSGGCATGEHPGFVPALAGHGGFYGVTESGGDGKGTIFLLTP